MNKILKLMIIIVIIIILIISGILIILFKNQSENKVVNELQNQEAVQQEITRVQDRNDFFTVTNCVDRYITYLTTKEKEILYDYLDEEYKRENGITIDNIYAYVQTLDDYYKFKAKEMYICNISNTLSQYFVYGILTPETTEREGIEKEFYISIKLDKLNNTFSVIPNKKVK